MSLKAKIDAEDWSLNSPNVMARMNDAADALMAEQREAERTAHVKAIIKQKDIGAFMALQRDEAFETARAQSSRSKDPSTKVGALIWRIKESDNGELIREDIAFGVNVMPDGVGDLPAERWNNRDWKYKLNLHGESNAISLAAREGKAVAGANISSPACPCRKCASLIAEAAIAESSFSRQGDYHIRWAWEVAKGKQVMENAGTEMVVLRDNHYLPLLEESAAHLASLGDDVGSVQSVLPDFAHHPAEPLDTSNLSKPLAWLAARADKLKSSSPLEPRFQSAGIVFDLNASPLLEAYARPPRGTDASAYTSPQELYLGSMEPERILIAQAARFGVKTKGLGMMLTQFPRGQGANMIAQSGIAQLFVDAQSLNFEHIDKASALDIWMGYLLLRESNVELHFVNNPKHIDPFAKVREALGNDLPPVTEKISHTAVREVSVREMGEIARAQFHAAQADAKLGLELASLTR